MKYLVTTSADNEMPCNVKELELASKLYPKMIFQSSHFIKSLSCFLCVLRKFNGFEKHFGIDYMSDIKAQSPEN